jgi:hypothetical protein
MTHVTALIASIAIETLVLMTWLRNDVDNRARRGAIAITPTLLTHPFLWMASRHFAVDINSSFLIIGFELLVIFVEGVILCMLIDHVLARCLFMSSVANFTSAFFGWLWWYFC